MAVTWITTAEASEISGYHPDYIRKLIRGGKVNARKFGVVWQVARGSLMAHVHTAEKLGEKRGPKKGS